MPNKETIVRIQFILDDYKKNLISTLPVQKVFDYSSLKAFMPQNELQQELALIEDMLLEPDTIEERLLLRCDERAANSDNSIAFQYMFDTPCNRLYWHLVCEVFKPVSLPEMLAIILPGIKRELIVLPPSLPENLPFLERRKYYTHHDFKNNISLGLIPINPPSSQAKELSKAPEDRQPMTSDSFHVLASYLFFQDIMFDLKEIAFFSLPQHIKLHDLLHDEYKGIAKQLYQHNIKWQNLKFDMMIFRQQGITPYAAMEELSKRLKQGSTLFTGKPYAQISAIEAVSRFQDYFYQLPQELQSTLRTLKSHNDTLGEIIDDLNKDKCVELLSLKITNVLKTHAANPILNKSPAMNAENLNGLLKKYQYDHNELSNKENETIPGLNSIKDSRMVNVFPQKLLEIALEQIKLDDFESLVYLLINLPPSFYNLFWSSNKLSWNVSVLLKNIILAIQYDFFIPAQKQALGIALIQKYCKNLEVTDLIYLLSYESNLLSVFYNSLKDNIVDFINIENHRDNVIPNLFSTVIKKNDHQTLQVLFDLYPRPKVIDLLLEGPVSLFESIIKDGISPIIETTLDYLFSDYEFFSTFLNSYQSYGTILHLAARNKEAFPVVIQRLLNLDYDERQRLCRTIDVHGDTMLHVAVAKLLGGRKEVDIFQSLQPVLSAFLPEDPQDILSLLSQCDAQDKTVLEVAMIKMQECSDYYDNSVIKLIFSLLPPTEFLNILSANSLLTLKKLHWNTLIQILEQFPAELRFDIITQTPIFDEIATLYSLTWHPTPRVMIDFTIGFPHEISLPDFLTALLLLLPETQRFNCLTTQGSNFYGAYLQRFISPRHSMLTILLNSQDKMTIDDEEVFMMQPKSAYLARVFENSCVAVVLATHRFLQQTQSLGSSFFATTLLLNRNKAAQKLLTLLEACNTFDDFKACVGDFILQKNNAYLSLQLSNIVNLDISVEDITHFKNINELEELEYTPNNPT